MTTLWLQGASAIGTALAVDATLQTLYLNGNHICFGAFSLAEGLETNRTLTTLFLNDNRIGEAGEAALECVLESNPTLSTLVLRGNSTTLPLIGE